MALNFDQVSSFLLLNSCGSLNPNSTHLIQIINNFIGLHYFIEKCRIRFGSKGRQLRLSRKCCIWRLRRKAHFWIAFEIITLLYYVLKMANGSSQCSVFCRSEWLPDWKPALRNEKCIMTFSTPAARSASWLTECLQKELNKKQSRSRDGEQSIAIVQGKKNKNSQMWQNDAKPP